MKGKCTNLDDNCPNFNKIIEVPDDQDFICPKCGHPLYEIEGGHKGGISKKVLAIVIAAVIVVIVAAIIFIAANRKEEIVNTERNTPPQEEQPEDTSSDSSLFPSNKTQPSPGTNPNDTNIHNHYNIIVYENIDTSRISIKYSFGWYEGSTNTFTVNGSKTLTVPNGSGTLHFVERAPVPSRDPELMCIADDGDYVEGQWQNGALISGRLYSGNERMKRTLEPGASPNREPLDIEKLYQQFCQTEE